MDAPAASTSVKVAVRLRPFNHSEKENDSKLIIKIHPRESQCTIVNPNKDNDEKSFTYDFLYNSFLPEDDENHASQQTVWNDLGNELLDAAWSGYNYSLFAYGQTGSGKSHSMVGFGDQRGIIPRACEAIFLKIRESENEAAKAQLEAGDSGAGGNNASNSGPDTTYKIEVSMLEIYNEKVRDLFVPLSSQDRGGLKVRDSPKTGAYVEGLKKIPVIGYHQIERLMAFGSRNRTVASTMMNETSSRAHTIFTITFVQTRTNRETMKVSDIRSSISLVDLAGSERAGKTGATGDRLVEGGHINKSLSALGNVINALSTNATKKKKLLVPYRDAVLTHLLKNSLGGNAKTTMIAAISPADTNYGETLSTLRYADRAKNIQNVAIVNEDANEKLIRQLREQMEALRKQLENTNSGGNIEEERERMKKELEEKVSVFFDCNNNDRQWKSFCSLTQNDAVFFCFFAPAPGRVRIKAASLGEVPAAFRKGTEHGRRWQLRHGISRPNLPLLPSHGEPERRRRPFWRVKVSDIISHDVSDRYPADKGGSIDGRLDDHDAHNNLHRHRWHGSDVEPRPHIPGGRGRYNAVLTPRCADVVKRSVAG